MFYHSNYVQHNILIFNYLDVVQFYIRLIGLVFLFLARLWISHCAASEWESDACSDSETSLFLIVLQNIPHHESFY